jgi:hypothetical protein
MAIQILDYHTNEGHKTVLVDDTGWKMLKVLMMDGGLIVRTVPNSETRYMTQLTGKQIALTTRIKQFRSYGRETGMTKAAKAFLSKATAA